MCRKDSLPQRCVAVTRARNSAWYAIPCYRHSPSGHYAVSTLTLSASVPLSTSSMHVSLLPLTHLIRQCPLIDVIRCRGWEVHPQVSLGRVRTELHGTELVACDHGMGWEG